MKNEIISLPGDRWEPKKTGFVEDLPLYWGNWGVGSEVDKLRAVLVRRPGKEIENFDAQEVRFSDEPVDVKLMRKQHDDVIQIYKDHNVDVYYVEEQRGDRPNAIYCRDMAFMTPEGAILSRMAMEMRRGEERYFAQALANLGVPIIKTVHGNGTFEGANAMWVDRETVILATSIRTNREGFDQVKSTLEYIGVKDIIYFQVPYSNIHIDGLLNIPTHEHVLVHAQQVPYDVCDALKRKGFKVLEAPTYEAVKHFGINFVALEPGVVVQPAGNPQIMEILEKEGIKVIPVEIGEILKGRGAIHCMSVFLKRG